MDVMVAQSAGFCYGVKRAVDMARDTAHRGAPCVMLGSIIHNANVVAELEALGMRKAESWQEVLPGETVVILKSWRSWAPGASTLPAPMCCVSSSLWPRPRRRGGRPLSSASPITRRSWVWPAGRIGR